MVSEALQDAFGGVFQRRFKTLIGFSVGFRRVPGVFRGFHRLSGEFQEVSNGL